MWTIARSRPVDLSRGNDRDAEAAYAVTLRRDDEERQTTVYIARTVTDSSTDVAEETLEAMRSQGESAVAPYLDDQEPPRYITCSTMGCSPS
jgi:hypothetical protein